ncbi:MAG TPA: DUF2160 family membrane protein [Pseudomonadales bacterium]
MQWMAWTWPTAAFFLCVALALAVLTLLELRHPTRRRRGWLPIPTTRGDRFFIALLTAAAVHVLWLAMTDAAVLWASVASLVIAAVLMARG